VCLEADERLGRLPANVELALFRVLQEALTNVHRHAKASAVAVRIVRGHDRVLMEIRDDGRVIAPIVLRRFLESGAGPGVGLTGMRERVRELNGELSVNSNENGTILTVSVPVPAVLPDQATQAA
jgi:signal transduction histidine kinase